MSEPIEFLSAVLVVSRDVDRLATFYRDVLGLPLEEERHPDTQSHYGCELGDLHFALHPYENFAAQIPAVGAIKLAFTVFDLPKVVERLESQGVRLVYPPKDNGFMTMTALYDPDGNYIELTQLSDRWYQHLVKRKDAGHDVVSRWHARRQQSV